MSKVFFYVLIFLLPFPNSPAEAAAAADRRAPPPLCRYPSAYFSRTPQSSPPYRCTDAPHRRSTIYSNPHSESRPFPADAVIRKRHAAALADQLPPVWSRTSFPPAHPAKALPLCAAAIKYPLFSYFLFPYPSPPFLQYTRTAALAQATRSCRGGIALHHALLSRSVVPPFAPSDFQLIFLHVSLFVLFQ